MYFVSPTEMYFPPSDTANAEGLLAIGGDLSPERILLAYRSGIFPWFSDDEPILWWSPPKRMVLFFDDLVISNSMRNIINRKNFTVTFNTNFREVISSCRQMKRKGQTDTWITNEMVEAYCMLHDLGIAKSVEAWQDGKLSGGLYGVDLGNIFCGESMFSTAPNASKIAFIALAKKLKSENYQLLDCQIYNNHLKSLGASEILRSEFLQILRGKAIL